MPPRMFKTKQCARCGQAYTPTTGNQKYCSEHSTIVEQARVIQATQQRRDRLHDAGFREINLWVHNDDRDRLKKFAARLIAAHATIRK